MQQVAIKLEKDTEEQQPAVCIDAAILKLQFSEANRFPKFIEFGSYLNYKYLVMELLGPNMIELVNIKRPYKFSLCSTLKFGIQAIELLKTIHNKGFVHRDIKPGSFVIGNTKTSNGIFYLIDFGSCKKLYIQDGIITKPTSSGRFKGALMYASLNSHHHIELGRHDDLMSLLYILVEFYNGMLPWSDVDDKEKVQKMKENFHGDKLLEQLPKQFLEFESHIKSLDYTTDPDYALLTSLLKQSASENDIDLNAPFEWEKDMNSESMIIMQHHDQIVQKANINYELLELKIKSRSNTIQSFVEVLDALTGSVSEVGFNPFEVNNQNDTQSSHDRNSFVGQNINEQKNKDDQQTSFEWDTFMGTVKGNNQFQGFESIQTDEEPNTFRITLDVNQDQAGLISNTNNDNSIYKPDEVQKSLSNQSSPSQRDKNATDSIFVTSQQQQQENNSSITRKLSQEMLDAPLIAINDLIHNSSSNQTHTSHSKAANKQAHKKPLIVVKDIKELEPIPITPQGTQMREELKEWNL
ncbi:MAG: putative protein serine/threonine kinase [Streblomastix strix]|uniref:Protein kinase domain-containing protein n=1 Tax=Streblomastix strix TaxID=222440 RepID=A0A5J4WR01_9EUKA|nr:MAG: putative protein serine/threonine kinase [Streblomastix strix]